MFKVTVKTEPTGKLEEYEPTAEPIITNCGVLLIQGDVTYAYAIGGWRWVRTERVEA